MTTLIAIFVRWEDGDGHYQYDLIALASDETKARELVRAYAARSEMLHAYGSPGSLDPESVIFRNRSDYGPDPHFICETISVDSLPMAKDERSEDGT